MSDTPQDQPHRRAFFHRVGVTAIVAGGPLGVLNNLASWAAGSEKPDPFPKATLALVGGGVPDLNILPPVKKLQAEPQETYDVFAYISKLADKEKPRIELITTASEKYSKETAAEHTHAFASVGCPDVGVIDPRSRDEAMDATLAERIRKADIVMITGGDQERLTSILGGTPMFEALKDRAMNDPNFVLAGSSAGSAVMSPLMVNGGDVASAVEMMIPGFGFVPGVIMDTHVNGSETRKPRHPRLCAMVAAHPDAVGVGLDEKTGVCIKHGNMEVFGAANVMIVAGKNVKTTPNENLAVSFGSVAGCASFKDSGMHAFVLSEGQSYDLKTHSCSEGKNPHRERLQKRLNDPEEGKGR